MYEAINRHRHWINQALRLYDHARQNLKLPSAILDRLGRDHFSEFTTTFKSNFRISDLVCLISEEHVWDNISDAGLEVFHFSSHSSFNDDVFDSFKSSYIPKSFWLYLSSSVLADLRKCPTGKYSATATNLRARMRTPEFDGFAFITFQNAHCVGYVYNARTGALSYADGMGGRFSQEVIELVGYILQDLGLNVPTTATSACVALQGRAIGSCNIVARCFIACKTGRSNVRWEGAHASQALRDIYLCDLLVYNYSPGGVSKALFIYAPFIH